ncbi:MAG: benzoyl-CoA 2,3-epoxidase subunit BoxB, partial [Alphaproteobacteria bacterium]|nr:benzoyl-CoA 2,3-epoxidase subunit BoxB [Alphaproteobacteria bacterium]
MVYLLQAYFGRDGREEADALLERRSGNPDKPRILQAFNEKTPDWLSFFMFTFFTDRDGKYQLASLAESGFDPLARSCRFMLTEEAHHMFVGETGVGRTVERACQLMKQHDTDDLRKVGGISLALIQKYLNFHFSVTLDLFGSEVSTNAATFYTAGLKGRFDETRVEDDHQLKGATYDVLEVDNGKLVTKAHPALNALNERLRDDYIKDCAKGVERWNRVIRKAGVDFELKLPHRAFHRRIGMFSGIEVSPKGEVMDKAAWDKKAGDWLPTDAERAYVGSLMQNVTERGKMANWIAPPARGINNQPVDFDYVRLG